MGAYDYMKRLSGKGNADSALQMDSRNAAESAHFWSKRRSQAGKRALSTEEFMGTY